MKRFVLPLLAAVLGGLVTAWIINQNRTVQLEPIQARANMVEAERDPELAAAVLRARKELPRFIAALQKPEPYQNNFAINARFETPKGPEQIWVSVTKYENKTFIGTLADQPYAIEKLNKGDAVRIPEAAVNDWLFRNEGKIAGGYTMQLLLKRAGERPGK